MTTVLCCVYHNFLLTF